MRQASPYTPGAGTRPPYLAGRQRVLEDAEKKITILLEKDGELKEEEFDAE